MLTCTHEPSGLMIGAVRLGGSQTTGSYILPPLIQEFQSQFPDVSVHLQVDSTRQVCRAVARGELDVALVGGEVPSDLQSRVLVRARAMLPVSTVHFMLRCAVMAIPR